MDSSFGLVMTSLAEYSPQSEEKVSSDIFCVPDFANWMVLFGIAVVVSPFISQ